MFFQCHELSFFFSRGLNTGHLKLLNPETTITRQWGNQMQIRTFYLDYPQKIPSSQTVGNQIGISY